MNASLGKTSREFKHRIIVIKGRLRATVDSTVSLPSGMQWLEAILGPAITLGRLKT